MLYNKEVKQIKDQIVKQIIGNYLKGAGENTAYLKEVKASNLGAVFLNYGEAIDLTSETLVDYNKSNPKMQSAGTLSLLIKETFDKIDRYAMKCETMEYPTAVVKKDLTKYANSLLDGVNIVAFSEGEADIDLKSDIKILLREGREEFNKRMSEEEDEIKEAQDKATQDPTATEDAPTEEEATDDVEDDSDFIEEDTPEEDTDAEEETDETDEEEAEDEEVDYDKLAEDEYGSDEEEAEEKNEDDDIPTGESYFSFGEGLTDIANKFKAKIKATIEQSKKDKADKKVENFMKNIDSYVETMEEFIYGTDLESCIKAYDLTMDRIDSYIDNARMKQTYGDTYPKIEEALFTKVDELSEEFSNYTRDVFGIEEMESDFSFGEDFAGVFKSIKNTVKSVTGSIAKYWHDISEKARIANEKAKQPRSYSTISPEEKEAQRQKSLDSFNEWFNKYISDMTPYLNSKDKDTCWGSYELARKFLDEIYFDPATALTYGYAYNDVLDIIHDEITTVNKNFVKHMKDTFDVDLSDQVVDKSSGSGESHMFKRKYGYTTIDPQAFSEMINTLLETERDTLKTFAESRGLSFVANSTDYVITSKTLINTTAVVLAARYKFGFYN